MRWAIRFASCMAYMLSVPVTSTSHALGNMFSLIILILVAYIAAIVFLQRCPALNSGCIQSILLHKICKHHIKLCDLYQPVVGCFASRCISVNLFELLFHGFIIGSKFIGIAKNFRKVNSRYRNAVAL